MRPCMIYNPGSFGHCLDVLFMSLTDTSIDDVVVPLILFTHDNLMVC